MNKDLKRISKKMRDLARAIDAAAAREIGDVYAGNPVRDGKGKTVASRGGIIAKHFSKGAKYKPLSSDYAAWKAKKFPGRPTLVRTGRLKGSVVGKGTVTLNPGGVKVKFSSVPEYGRHLLAERNWIRATAADKAELRSVHADKIKRLVRAFNQKGRRSV